MTFRYDTWNIFTCNIMSILQIILFTWNVSFAWHFLFRVSFLHIHILREHLQHKQQQEKNPPSGINKIFWLKKTQNIKQKQKIMGNGTQNTLLRIQLWWSNEPAQHILWVIKHLHVMELTVRISHEWKNSHVNTRILLHMLIFGSRVCCQGGWLSTAWHCCCSPKLLEMTVWKFVWSVFFSFFKTFFILQNL